MDNTDKLLTLIISFMEKQLEKSNWLDYFILYGVPLIQVIALIVTAWFGYHKYKEAKNKDIEARGEEIQARKREISIKILSEVYAPLYSYFVKQEMAAYLLYTSEKYQELDRNILPIFDVVKTRFISSDDEKGIRMVKAGSEAADNNININSQVFKRIIASVNMGLASKELYTLLNMYNALLAIETEKDKSNDSYYKATIMKIDIEKKLREEIIKGYNHYHKQLGLDSLTQNDFYKINEDYLEITYDIPLEEIEKIKNSI